MRNVEGCNYIINAGTEVTVVTANVGAVLI